MSALLPQHASTTSGRDDRQQAPSAPTRLLLSHPTHSLFSHFTVRDTEYDKDAAERILLVLEKGSTLIHNALSLT